MKNTIWIVIFMIFGTDWVYADEYVQGHSRSDGTYVQGYQRSNSDGNSYNNYSYQGNPNPYKNDYTNNNRNEMQDAYNSYKSSDE